MYGGDVEVGIYRLCANVELLSPFFVKMCGSWNHEL
jgi:hypothetical protein